METWHKLILLILGTYLLFKLLVNISYMFNYQNEIYYQNLTSISKHQVPNWYEEAKFGIKIHWGLYSIPCFAPKLLKNENRTEWSSKNPSSEWYINTMSFQDSETKKYHEKYYKNEDYYESFIPKFQNSLKNWIPSLLINSIFESEVKYLILNVKSHDGWKLWDSSIRKFRGNIQRNIVNEMSKHSRKKNLNFGVSLSGLDLSICPSCNKERYNNALNDNNHKDSINIELKELFMNDVDLVYIDHSFPPNINDLEIISLFYNKNKDGIINDKVSKSWSDIQTFDYNEPTFIPNKKWELNIPFGNSNGYNFNEGRDELIDDFDLLELLIRVVSRNGNLVLNVGLNPSGYLPEIQSEKLINIGKWLKRYGEAIFYSKPWKISDLALENVKLYFTQNIERNIVFIFIIMRDDKLNQIEIPKSIFGNEERNYFVRSINDRLKKVEETEDKIKIEFENFQGKKIFILKISK